MSTDKLKRVCQALVGQRFEFSTCRRQIINFMINDKTFDITTNTDAGQVYHILMQVRTQIMGCHCFSIFKNNYQQSQRDKLYCHHCHPPTDDWSNLYFYREMDNINQVLGPFMIKELNVDLPDSNLISLPSHHLARLFSLGVVPFVARYE